MFDLSAEQMAGKRILDCPSGACSFTAVANRRGVDVTAADIAYFYAPEELEAKGCRILSMRWGIWRRRKRTRPASMSMSNRCSNILTAKVGRGRGVRSVPLSEECGYDAEAVPKKVEGRERLWRQEEEE